MWLIRDHRFDCVVCDTMYGGVLAARLEKTPVVFITNQNHFNGLNGTTNPVWMSLNFIIRRYIRFSDQVIVPDYPAPDTVSEYNIIIPKGEEKHYTFTGPFFELDHARYPSARETIFTSFGGEPYKLPMYQMLKEIADRRKDLSFDVFYTGAVLPDSTDNFVSHGYVPDLYEHLARAKIAIAHGGLTTLHEAMLFEKPVMIIMDPDHPEQQNNAKKIVDMGAGTFVNGKLVTLDLLEKKIAETMTCCPRPCGLFTKRSMAGRTPPDHHRYCKSQAKLISYTIVALTKSCHAGCEIKHQNRTNSTYAPMRLRTGIPHIISQTACR
jgi:uncharacterized protein (TIGR00661 family)